jgi:hypothetical protein
MQNNCKTIRRFPGSHGGVRPASRQAVWSRSGQALLEFAFILFIVVFLFGGALSLGYFFYSAQGIQMAADVAAQEIARMPLPPTADLGLGDLEASSDTVIWDPRFQAEIYDERYLVVRRSEIGARTLGQFAATEMPLLNRLLVGVMIFDPSYDPDGDGGVFRYPGAIVRNVTTGAETVLVPVMAYDDSGEETIIRWVAPVEEIRVDVSGDGFPDTGPFSVIAPPGAPPGFAPGTVALRINYPAQAAGLINRSRDAGAVFSGDDLEVTEDGDVGSNYELIVPHNEGPFDSRGTSRIHAGRYGLGRQAAYYLELGVRPYRRVLTAEAIYRREVFE